MKKFKVAVAEPDAGQVETFANELKVSPILAAVLLTRGFQNLDSAKKFLNPELSSLHEPNLLPDYEKAIHTIRSAGESGDKIFVHGDYDVDGVTSAALIARCLEKLGYEVTAKVPHRQQGFGVHLDAVNEAEEWGAKLLITCDCGTASIDQVKAAREKGMAVVVTDHHPPSDVLPDANAVVNPHRADSSYPFADLSGVGVAFKLGLGLSQEHGVKTERFIEKFLDLATLGTVADVVPLLDENRVIVAHGLPYLWDTKKVGLRCLIDRSIPVDRLTRAKSNKDTSPISFQIAPRLNSIGRIDDAGIALSLLMSNSLEEARTLSDLIERKNTERREEQDKMIELATSKLEALDVIPPYIVIADKSWQPGIAGIVAGRLKDRYGKPALVLGFDQATNRFRGSVRSIPGINAADSVRAAHGYLDGGGHPGAAGAVLLIDDLVTVTRLLSEFVLLNMSEDKLIPQYFADLKLKLDDVKIDDARDLSKMAPFGEANREPTFLIEQVKIESISAISQGRFTKLIVRQSNGVTSHEMMVWQEFELISKQIPKEDFSVLAHLRTNSFRGVESMSWSVISWG